VNANRLARTAGLLYLVVAVTSGPAQFFRSSLLVAGDPAATAANVRDNADSLRLALVADLIGIAAFVGVALALYFLLREIGPRTAATLLVFVVVSATIEAADAINHVAALLLATQPAYAGVAGASAASDALVMLFLELHKQGYLIAQVFFGLWLIPLGYLVWRSEWLPRLFGAALAFGGVCYLAALVPVYASSTFESAASVPIAMPAGIAEIAFAVWLAVVGLNAHGRTQPQTLSRGPAL
jgi:hypothetical protein